MAIKLDPKPAGVLSVLLGIAALVVTRYMVINEGQFYTIVAIIGPPAIIWGIALLALPATMIFRTHKEERDGMEAVVYDRNKPNVLGYLFIVGGVLLGLGLCLYLTFGDFWKLEVLAGI